MKLNSSFAAMFALFGFLSTPGLSQTVIVMRHGQSFSNTQNINNGNTALSVNFPLTELGEKQVEDAAKKLNAEHQNLVKNIAWVYVSPLKRAQQTAEILMKSLGLSQDKLITDYTIMESGFGDNEGKNADHERNKDPVFAKAHYAETGSEVSERLRVFIQRVEKVHKDQTLLVVTHGSPMIEIVNLSREARARGQMPLNAEFHVVKIGT